MRKKNIKLARQLRRNMTDAEIKLWNILRGRNLGVKFRRQEPIGKYIVDFVCYEKKLVIEIDGGQHCGDERDEIRDRWLENQGFRVLRFWNNEVLSNIEGVVEIIKKNLFYFPSPQPSSRQDVGREGA